jgi:hypothetical protein
MRTLDHVLFTSDSRWDLKWIDSEAAIIASPDDASDIPAILDQEEYQEAIDSKEYVDQCLVHIALHSILQSNDDLPPDPTIRYTGPKSILHKDPDF